MSNITHGMNVEAVRSLAGQMRAQAGQIGDVITNVSTLVSQSQDNWKGRDAIQFESWWSGEHKPALVTLQDRLEGLAQAAENNAQEQENIS